MGVDFECTVAVDDFLCPASRRCDQLREAVSVRSVLTQLGQGAEGADVASDDLGVGDLQPAACSTTCTRPNVSAQGLALIVEPEGHRKSEVGKVEPDILAGGHEELVELRSVPAVSSLTHCRVTDHRATVAARTSGHR